MIGTTTRCFCRPLNRHPLQELVVDTFVPNDVHIAGGANGPRVDSGQDDALKEQVPNVVICTGANACGKVYPTFPSFPFDF